MLAAVTLLVPLLLVWGCAGRDVTTPTGIEQVQHVIVIYMETGFNGQFGLFPGANASASHAIRQVHTDGSPFTTLPQPLFNGQPIRASRLTFRSDPSTSRPMSRPTTSPAIPSTSSIRASDQRRPHGYIRRLE